MVRLRLGQGSTDKEAADDTDGCESVTELDDQETALVLAAPQLAARSARSSRHGGGAAVHAYLSRCLAETHRRDRVELRRLRDGF